MKFLPILPILTRYPFLRISGSVFSDIDLKREIEKRPEVVEIGKQIVLCAIEGKHFKRDYIEADIPCTGCDEVCYECKEIGKFDKCNLCLKCFENCKLKVDIETEMMWRTRAKISVLSYICSRMIVSSFEDWARMRYAVSEAEYYRRILNTESDAVVKLVAIDLGIKLNGWRVHVSSFVRASSRIRSDEWRLVNRTVDRGFVDTTRRDVERIIQEMLRIRLFEKVPSIDEANLSSAIKTVSKKISRESKKFDVDLGEVDLECFPPCMKEILSELRRGMNVPHTARFALTSFLLNIGMSVDEIIDLFKTAPDFDEEKTRYQVEHIAGQRGKGTEYTSPSCDTMRTYQNCVSDCKVTHPLKYYALCKKKKKVLKK